MKTEFEEYRDTGMLGAYAPEKAVLREAEGGDINTIFRDSSYWNTKEGVVGERNMLIEGRVFHVTSVFPSETKATPTDKLLSLIDSNLAKDIHGG